MLLTLALWVASLAWMGFVALRTVLDPNRSRAVAEAVYDDPDVRDRLADNLAGVVAAAVPQEVPVSDEQLREAARQALASEAVEAGVVDVLVRVHRGFLGEGEIPESIELGALEEGLRQALAERNPELAAALPALGPASVPLPTEKVPDLGTPRRWLSRLVPLLALAGLAGIAVALVATNDRPGVLARTGWRALILAGGFLAVAVGLPWVLGVLAPAQAEVAAALAGAMASSALGPAFGLAAAGGAALLLGRLWSAAGTSGERTHPAPVSRIPPPAPPAPPAPPRSAPPASTTQPRSAPPASPRPVLRYPPRWVDGAGWVLDPSEPDVPEGARWQAGHGWVVDGPPPPPR